MTSENLNITAQQGTTANEEAQQTQPAELSIWEQRALEKGWKPKEHFDGDPDDWRPAREWIERGELFERIRHVSKEANEAKSALHNVYQEFIKYRQGAYKQALDELKKERKEAMREGDFDRVEQLEEKEEQTRQELSQEEAKFAAQVQAVQQAAKEPSVEFTEWINRNPWYAKDAELRDAADGIAINFMRDHQGRYNPKDLGEFVEQRIKKLFPDKFKRTLGPPSPDSSGSQRGTQTNTNDASFAKIENEMSEEERKIMSTLIKHGGISKEQYMKDYIAAKRG